jgi:putative SOS response-associated peptidase YedK
MAMAGVWQNYEINGSIITTCAIVTTEANKTMSEIHHRLPVIIDPEDWPLWLGEDGKGAAKLMRPIAEHVLDVRRVNTAVNSNCASGRKLWEEV